jgi:transmembrane sensor
MRNKGEWNAAAGPESSERDRPSVLDWPRQAGVVDRLLPAIDQRVRRRRQNRWSAIATGLAALAVVGTVWLGRPTPPEKLSPTSVSRLVLPATQVLPDGSVVQLRNGAEVSIAFDEGSRRVILLRGEAHFQVTKNARRPFIVVAGGVEIRAVGTAFGVELGQQAVQVLVTEGRVAIDQKSAAPVTQEPEPLALLNAGSHATIDINPEASAHAEVKTVSQSEIDERMAWRAPKLDLTGTPLEEVVLLFNQHGRTHFVLAEPVLGKLQVSGLLRVDHPELLVRLLERDFGIRAERRGGDEIVLSRTR